MRTYPGVARLMVCATFLVWGTGLSAAPDVISEPLARYGFGSLSAAALSPDGRLLATAGNGDIVLWDTVTSTALRPIPGPGFTVDSIAFSPDGARLAGSGASSEAYLGIIRPGSSNSVPRRDDTSHPVRNPVAAGLAIVAEPYRAQTSALASLEILTRNGVIAIALGVGPRSPRKPYAPSGVTKAPSGLVKIWEKAKGFSHFRLPDESVRDR
jgi:WD40 repeat protein